MGNRRLSRKRLYQVEKLGQKVDLESGAGIKDNIVSASQHRQGQEIITEIAIDLAASGNILKDGGGDKDLIGHASLPSYITQLTVAKFGIVTEVRVVVAEIIENDDGDIGGDGIDLVAGDGAAGIADGAGGTANGGGTRVDMTHSVRVKGADASALVVNNGLADKYLYICSAETSTASSPMATGKIIVYIHGFVAPDDL